RGRAQKAGGCRRRPRRRAAWAVRAPAESEDATVRRVGVVGPHTRSFPGKPAGRDRSRREIWRLDGRGCEARRKPPHAAGVGSLLLLAARHDARNAAPRLLVGEPDAANDAPRGREDGSALARPLRYAREQSARLPQDASADRTLRALC